MDIRALTIALLCCPLALSACADDRGGDDGQLTDTGITIGDGDGDGDGEYLDVGGGDTGGNTGDGSSCECAPKSDQIFVLSDSAELWQYRPVENQFDKLGSFDCGVTPTTFSMGVARDGRAWIMFRPDGDIYTVDVNAANNCTDPGYTTGQLGFDFFGMAFASNSASDPCDHLYLHSFDDVMWSEGPGVGLLAKLGAGLSLSPIAPIDYNGGELTGTGDGRLFAFAGTPEAKLIEYDKANGGVLDTWSLPGLALTNAFAFAAWGGDFYFFTEADGLGAVSKVTKLDFDDSEGNGMVLTTVNSQAPIRIVGAGVSTCAPFKPPG